MNAPAVIKVPLRPSDADCEIVGLVFDAHNTRRLAHCVVADVEGSGESDVRVFAFDIKGV